MVEKGTDFSTSLSEHKKWLLKHLNKEPTVDNVLMVTCGDWDLRKMIDLQCKNSKLEIPKYFHKWCNLKILYSQFMGKKANGMTDMLKGLSLELKGRHHCGLDDCLNIGQCVSALFSKGCPMVPTTIRVGKKVSSVNIDLKQSKNFILFKDIKTTKIEEKEEKEEKKELLEEKIELKEHSKDKNTKYKGKILVHVHTMNHPVAYVSIESIDELEKKFDQELQKSNQKIKKKEFYFNGKIVDKNTKLTNDSIIYLGNDQSHKLFGQVTKFLNSEEKEMDFPNSLSNFERKFLHSLGEDYGLSTESKGEKSKRVLRMSKEKPKSMNYKKNMPFGMSEIFHDFLFLGSGADALDNDQLEQKKITHVLNLTEEWRKPLKRDLEFKRIPLKDVEQQSIVEHFEEAFEYVDHVKSQKGKILVHCVIGKSRSASFVVAYVMKEKKLDLNQALEFVRKKRDFIKPNEGFIKQLQDYEKKILIEKK